MTDITHTTDNTANERLSKAKKALSALPCFKRITQVVEIRSGLSQSSYKVLADGQQYFAKCVDNFYLGNEIAITQHAAKHMQTPKVVYQQKHWLISEFIIGDNLAQSSLDIAEKIQRAITLMHQCHQLMRLGHTLNAGDHPIDTLNTDDIAINLLNAAKEGTYSTQQHTQLLSSITAITQFINRQKAQLSRDDVFCHGDINFSNIMVDTHQTPWLIDFECCCIAPIEFDIAMFVAINTLDYQQTPSLIKRYESLQAHCHIDRTLVDGYLSYCYLINALWYTNTANSTSLEHFTTCTDLETATEKRKKLTTLANQQWQCLARFSQQNGFAHPSVANLPTIIFN